MTGLLNLTGWPARTRVIAREVPHPARSCGRSTMTGGGSPASHQHSGGQLPDRNCGNLFDCRGCAEDRIRCAKDIGLANLPLHDAASNAVWLAIVLIAYDSAHLDPDAVIGAAAGGRPKTLRLRLLAIAGRLTRSGRRTQLRLDRRWPWAATVTAAVARCAPSPPG